MTKLMPKDLLTDHRVKEKEYDALLLGSQAH
jgi:hypothetical protein